MSGVQLPMDINLFVCFVNVESLVKYFAQLLKSLHSPVIYSKFRDLRPPWPPYYHWYDLLDMPDKSTIIIKV